MKRIFGLIFLVFVVITLSAAPVHAGWGWLDNLFSPAKQVGKQFVKQEEKTVAKQAEKDVVKQEGKQVTKQEQIQFNRLAGDVLDDTFKLQWCKNNVCAKSAAEVTQSVKFSRSAIKLYLINDWEAQKFINNEFGRYYGNYFEHGFARRPDLIKIEASNGRVTGMTLHDVKSSKGAVVASERSGQFGEYEGLCINLNSFRGAGFCKVQYILPEQEITEFKHVLKRADDGTLDCSGQSLVIDVGLWAVRGTTAAPVWGTLAGAGVGVAMCFVDAPKLIQYLKYSAAA